MKREFSIRADLPTQFTLNAKDRARRGQFFFIFLRRIVRQLYSLTAVLISQEPWQNGEFVPNRESEFDWDSAA
jgi:hypothetical protein